VKKFSKQISASHSASRPDIRTSIEKVPKSQSNIQQWDSLKVAIQGISPVSAIIERPVVGSHAFGQAMSAHVAAGVKRVDAGATPGQIIRVKGQIDSATGDYATPNQLIKAAIYNARASTGRIESAIEAAYAEEVRGRELTRPSLREDTKRAIRNLSEKDPATGDFVDPNLPRLLIPKAGPFHYGHITGRENRVLVKEAQAQGMTQGEFTEWVNSHPEWFRVEDPTRNLSHEFEA
jgi:hypothetical protein